MSKTMAAVVLELAKHFSDADFRNELKQKLLIKWVPLVEEIEQAMKTENKK